MNNFSAPPEEVTFAGLLFDMDGTIIDSTEAVVKHWHMVGAEINVDPAIILASSHGRRSIDILKIYQPQKANWEYVSYMEGLIPKLYGSSATEIPGARDLLDSATNASCPWTIVTSGTRPLVTGWLTRLNLPEPEHLVVAEDVKDGKPDPTCYLLGISKLGLAGGSGRLKPGREVLVLEDSPAGIRAGKAAGCKVVAVVTSHTAQEVVDAGADWVVQDLRSLRITSSEAGKSVTIQIRDALISS